MKKLIPKLRLGTDKTTTAVNRIAIRQSDRGEEIHAFITTDTNEPYNLSNKYLVFKENKITGTAVRDSNVSITDASNGEIRYTLQDAVHGADGVAWFDIVDSSNDQLIDSTADFYIKAKDGLKFTALDVSYMSDLDKIKEELSKRISNEVDQQTADKLQQWKSNVDSAIRTMQQSYASVVDDFNSKYNQRYESITNSFNQVQSQIDTANSKISDAISSATNDVEQAKNSMQQNYANIVNDFDSKYKQQYNSVTESFNQVKNKVDGYNQAVQDFNNRIDTTVSNANNRLDTVVNNAKNRIDTTITNAESTLKNASDKAGETNKQLEQLVQDAKGKADSVNETLENLKQRTQKQEEDFNKVVVDTNNKVDTAINKIPDEIDKNLNAKDARVQELQNSITKLKDDVTTFDGKTKKQFEDIENHIKEVSNGIAHLDLSNYATKEDLKKSQPDLSNLVVVQDYIDQDNKYQQPREFPAIKNEKGKYVVDLSGNSAVYDVNRMLTVEMPQVHESLNKKADKSELSNYATKTDLNNKTERPLFEAMLQNYATKNELNSHQVDFSKLIIHYGKLNKDNNYIRSDEYKATKDEKGNFVFQLDDDWTPFRIKQILTKDLPKINQDIGNLQSTKADKSELGNYAKTGDITTAIQNVQIKQDSIDKEGKFTDSKVYFPTLVNGRLVFDLTDSYTTWYVANFKNQIANMQQQLEELKKKSLTSGKIQMIPGTMIMGTKQTWNSYFFDMSKYKDWKDKSYKLVTHNPAEEPFYQSSNQATADINYAEQTIYNYHIKGNFGITKDGNNIQLTNILPSDYFNETPTGLNYYLVNV